MKEEGWIKRHPILTGVITFFVLMFLVGLFSDESTETTSQSQVENLNVKDTLKKNTIATEQKPSPEEIADTLLDEITGAIVKELVDAPSEKVNSAMKVTRVIDGDTIEISTGERVRLICIDSRETGEPYYQEAKGYLTDLILSKEVELVKDKSETDRYDRLLRYIYFEGEFVNEMVVREGWAIAYPYSPDTTLCPQIQEAEQKAKNEGLGIWAEQEAELEEELIKDDSEIICSYNAYNCGDFPTHADAQAVFEYCGSGDIHQLDGDDDGSACETLP